MVDIIKLYTNSGRELEYPFSYLPVIEEDSDFNRNRIIASSGSIYGREGKERIVCKSAQGMKDTMIITIKNYCTNFDKDFSDEEVLEMCKNYAPELFKY